MKLVPLLMCCFWGVADASGFPPLTVSPDLVRSRGAAVPVPQPRVGVPPGVPVESPPPTMAAPAIKPAPSRPPERAPVAAPALDQSDAERAEAIDRDRAAEAPDESGTSTQPFASQPEPVAPESLRRAGPVAGMPEEAPPRVGQTPGVVEVSAMRIVGVRTVELVAEGEAELQRDGVILSADRLVYNELTDEAEASGNVRWVQGDDWMTGSWARFIVHEWVGEIEAPAYLMSRPSKARPGEIPAMVSGAGHADTIYFEGENQYRLVNATWSTCKPESPDWYIRAAELELDYDREVGTARGTSLVFKDVPIFWWPWMEFPLAEQRQSGFLTPTMGVSNKTGVDLSFPYYWNIAPNYDATIAPRYMGRRGLQLAGEFRYLSENYRGTSRIEWLPRDKVTGEGRTLGSLQHVHRITPRLSASLDLNAVSDDDYFEDLSSRVGVASRVNLLREGRIAYSGGWWRASALAQSYQTLAGTGPYRRLPQLLLTADRADLPGGVAFGFRGEYVHFKHADETRAEGRRFVVYPQVSYTYRQPGYYITPKIGLHHTRYSLDRAASDPSARTSITRNLPIFSVDSGMVFERETSVFGQAYTQTLEPRFFYLRVPHRNQDDIPLFDTSRYDFGFAQIFSENRFSGSDRIGDANELTVAVTSRLIDPASGAERLRATLGQRFFFRDRRVLLSPTDERRKRTDLLAALSGRVTQSTSLDTAWQYNPFDKVTERFNFAVRYQPEFAKVLNVGYRFSRDVLEDVDISAQWPLGGRWYGVGRVTRSLKERRVTEAVAGVEYVSQCGCWVFRTAAHRFATNPDRVTNALFFQLELNGLGSVGASPLNLLQRSVPGYGKINESLSDRFFGEE